MIKFIELKFLRGKNQDQKVKNLKVGQKMYIEIKRKLEVYPRKLDI